MSEEAPETAELDELMRLIYRLESPAESKKLFKSVIRHRTVGIYNAMLVHIQCPEARLVMSASEWRALGRRLKPDARPLVILRAFGPVSFVFELNDTEGEPLPEDAQPFLLPPDSLAATGSISNDQFLHCVRHCENLRINVVEQSGNILNAGGVINLGEDSFRITLNSDRPLAHRFATLCHELAHVYCGHVGTCKPLGVTGRSLPHPACEAEAELVAYLVAMRHGIQMESEAYLTPHFRYPDAKLYSLDEVLKAAGKVESTLAGNFRKRPPSK